MTSAQHLIRLGADLMESSVGGWQIPAGPHQMVAVVYFYRLHRQTLLIDDPAKRAGEATHAFMIIKRPDQYGLKGKNLLDYCCCSDVIQLSYSWSRQRCKNTCLSTTRD